MIHDQSQPSKNSNVTTKTQNRKPQFPTPPRCSRYQHPIYPPAYHRSRSLDSTLPETSSSDSTFPESPVPVLSPATEKQRYSMAEALYPPDKPRAHRQYI
uniref:Uncharacterized protein n=1 Tax=Spongospora subterranea TaxID=70186 RepID=A0A0H5QN50_9EUKA|eukprot:CRZ03615.1 hypothetical protein [Spongospora subterranea]